MLKVIKFSMQNCAPCRQLAPVFDEVKSQISDVYFLDIDVDQNSALAIQYNIRSVPTLIFEKDGQVVHRSSGVTNSSALTHLINSHK